MHICLRFIFIFLVSCDVVSIIANIEFAYIYTESIIMSNRFNFNIFISKWWLYGNKLQWSIMKFVIILLHYNVTSHSRRCTGVFYGVIICLRSAILFHRRRFSTAKDGLSLLSSNVPLRSLQCTHIRTRINVCVCWTRTF